MKPKFKKAVDTGDLVSTRLYLANEMMLDPRGKSFVEMRNYAESVIPELYDVHDGSIFENNKELWNENLLFSIKNDLDSNFSRERLVYYFNLAKEVLKDTAANLDEEERKAAEIKNVIISTNSSTSTSSSQNKRSNKNIYQGVTIGGAALGVFGLILKNGVVATLGLAGVVIGAALLYNEHRK